MIKNNEMKERIIMGIIGQATVFLLFLVMYWWTGFNNETLDWLYYIGGSCLLTSVLWVLVFIKSKVVEAKNTDFVDELQVLKDDLGAARQIAQALYNMPRDYPWLQEAQRAFGRLITGRLRLKQPFVVMCPEKPEKWVKLSNFIRTYS